MNPITRYARWLHTQWPAGTVEKLPKVNSDGTTDVPGLRVVGDLTGIPLLKFSSDTGARAVQAIASGREPGGSAAGVLDLVIIGAGVSGMAAALKTHKSNLKFEILESSEPFSTIVNFPARKPIFTYPHAMKPLGDLQFREEVHPKEELIEDMRRETHGVTPRMAKVESVARRDRALEVNIEGEKPVFARNVIVAIGRSGNFRKLNVPGEDLDKVYNRLHDPKEFARKKVLVVGGGDSAIETAVALAEAGADVTIAYRGMQFSRPKPDNAERLSKVRCTILFGTKIVEIRPGEVVLTDGTIRNGSELETIANDAVFTMIGREAPLDFFRRSGVPINGDRGLGWWIGLAAFFLLCFWIYNWKSQYLWPGNSIGVPFPRWLDPDPSSLADRAKDPSTLLGTIAIGASSRSFYYTVAYTALIVIFGVRRIRRRKTPYVTWQTLALMAIQLLPLFLLPEIILPWLGHNGAFDSGAGRWIADQLFPIVTYGHGREYWRAYGFILAWPLMIHNVFSDQPMFLWLAICFVQTCVLIPLLIYFYGKGAYCGWICSCGAMAETFGDQHRHKMPHGPFWNRLNMAGQAILAFAVVLLILRIMSWVGVAPADRLFHWLKGEVPVINYSWLIDLFFAGAIGYGLYLHFSGRVWCRFFCPLAALMHIYARFSRFRILADKKKCISCNVCTSVCHQGIDVMNFANKGEPMADPECVRCSACVQMCPTGVLSFGQIDRKTGATIKLDPPWLAASPVLMREIGVNGRPHRL